MKLFSWSLDVLAPCCDVIISKLGQKDSNLYMMYKVLKSGTIITLVQKFFSDGKISEFWNIDPRCDVIIPKPELSGQTLHLRCVFQPLEIASFDHWFSWLPYRRVTFMDTYHCWYIIYKFRSFLTQFSITAS